jgi:ferredoxin
VTPRRPRMNRHLEVNPIACDGHGLCAELLPELIRLDDWGYPIVDPRPISPGLEAHVRRAVAACPTLALRVRERAAPAPPSPPATSPSPPSPSDRWVSG